MPLYEYRCEACHHQFERIQRFSDDPVSVCPACGAGPVVKLISSPAIQFKGSGWYITDYARKGGETQEGKPKTDGAATPASEKKPAADSTPAPGKTSSSAPASNTTSKE
jgi:putative FmdB family regulatory protein